MGTENVEDRVEECEEGRVKDIVEGLGDRRVGDRVEGCAQRAPRPAVQTGTQLRVPSSSNSIPSFASCALQGYLAHKKQRPPRTLK